MQHTFIHKLLLAILFGAIAAGLFEFYKNFIVGSMDSINGGYSTPGAVHTPKPTPRRF